MLFLGATSDVPFISHAMNEKKSHEIGIMSSVCSTLAKRERLRHVVDVGSGKGYLATTLYMQYQLSVIGIDSQTGNTHGALRRKQRLEKQYKGLVKRQQERTDNSRNCRNSEHLSEPPVRETVMRGESHEVTVSSEGHKVKVNSEGHKVMVNSESHNATEDDKPTHIALTAFIGPNDQLDKYVEPYFQNNQFMLTGLHTCGDLAGSMSRQFIHSPACTLMVGVGCCYHLISEMFCANPFQPKVDEEASATPQFPMSSFLRDKHVKLGRNCRMLSMQSKIGQDSVFDVSLFWRAHLQKILFDVHGYWRKDWILGKIASRCSSFREYVRKAFHKLHIESQLTDAQIDDYIHQHAHVENKMAMFFQLRTALSPAIESVILLDRCLYLLEQNATTMVVIKKLFHPSKSPRCYAIIAKKKEA
ncbi:METTL25 [Bugula neritina]|uniref:METTL25 n=1 Tax=Bugula neritina TaxID=10212 RepID=A0A7J7KQ53_BUGNE|nr:METTL25 [Bugula neritina]